jgi:hypothetical protein
LYRVQLEAYLDDHPEFLESYIVRKVDKTSLGKLLMQEELNQANASRKLSNLPIKKTSTGSVQKGSITPQRKISVASFAGCSESSLLPTVEDDSLSFLSLTQDFRKKSTVITDIRRRSTVITEINKNPPDDVELKTYKEKDAQEIFISELNMEALCFKIAKHFCNVMKAVSATTLLVTRNGEQLYFSGAAVNVKMESEQNNSFQQTLNLSPKIIDWFSDIVNGGKCVYFKKEEVKRKISSIAFLDQDFDQLCFLEDANDVVQALELILVGSHSYNATEKSINWLEISRIAGICLRNAAKFQALGLELIRSEVFLDLARIIFDQEPSIELTVLKILANLIILVDSEFAQLVLIDKDSILDFDRVFDLHSDDQENNEFDHLSSPFENRFQLNNGIITLVATVGEKVNIEDVSKTTESNSLLCIPLRDNDNNILAVVTLTNKITGRFTKDDENFVELFGLFCGIALENVKNYEAVKAAEAKCIPSTFTLQLHSFNFTGDELEDLETIQESLLNLAYMV